jgi:hypothetical protein
MLADGVSAQCRPIEVGLDEHVVAGRAKGGDDAVEILRVIEFGLPHELFVIGFLLDSGTFEELENAGVAEEIEIGIEQQGIVRRQPRQQARRFDRADAQPEENTKANGGEDSQRDQERAAAEGAHETSITPSAVTSNPANGGQPKPANENAIKTSHIFTLAR